MAQFTDTTGKTWYVSVTARTMILAKRYLGINLCDLCGNGPSTDEARLRAFGDVENFARILSFAIVDPPSNVLDLAAGLQGDSYNDAQSAFAEALIEFFPDPTMRQILREVYSQAENLAMMTTEQQASVFESLVNKHMSTCLN